MSLATRIHTDEPLRMKKYPSDAISLFYPLSRDFYSLTRIVRYTLVLPFVHFFPAHDTYCYSILSSDQVYLEKRLNGNPHRTDVQFTRCTQQQSSIKKGERVNGNY
jgi:hypothetical protein